MSIRHELECAVLDLPYFDMLLEGRRRGEPAARVFERFVHWGYWENPAAATLDTAEFVAAMERLNAEVVKAAQIADGQNVLDAGCGFGGTLAGLRAAFPRASLTGLNIDPRQLEHARAQVPNVTFIEGDACAPPFPDGSFDRVLAVECIFHFPSRAKFLKEAARMLKVGGRVALSDFVPHDPSARPGLLGRWVSAQVAKGYGASGDNWRDGDYIKMAAAAGLRVVLDRDITKRTLPTYPVLTSLLRTTSSARRMAWPTRLLEWASRLGFVRYRVLAFEKAA